MIDTVWSDHEFKTERDELKATVCQTKKVLVDISFGICG